MKHQLRLQLSPFTKIKEGTKRVEIRLFDEKRQLLQVSDEIEFSLMTDPQQTIQTRICALMRFNTFKELFDAYPPERLGANAATEWDVLYHYYTREQEETYGVLAIEIERI